MRTLILRLFGAAIFIVCAFAALSASAATYSGIVIDAKTGKVLYSSSADAANYPASLTKMMTLYLLFEAIEAGKISKSTRITVSEHAAAMAPSKLGIKPGGSLTAEQAILALVTKSANDIAAAVGESLAGSEPAFAVRMTRKARELGMRNTTFRNASGLPDTGQVTTARDMATLGIALREHFPQYYRYFSTRSFTWGRKRLANHNRLLGRVAGMDGIKTGYTRASGFNLVSSVRLNQRSVVAVVLGESTSKSRNARMRAILAASLPKASTGPDQLLIAKSPAIPQPRRDQQAILAEVPVPVARELIARSNGEIQDLSSPESQRIEVAHEIGERNLSQVSAVRLQPSVIAAIEERLRQMKIVKAPVPKRAVGQAQADGVLDPLRTAAVAYQQSGENGAAAKQIAAIEKSTPPSGWQIQIAAMPDRGAARDILTRTRAKLPKLLASYSDYTEPVAKDGATLYRARFSGFASKAQAWDACAALQKQKVGCLAIQN